MGNQRHLVIIDSRPIVRKHGVCLRGKIKPVFKHISTFASVSDFVVEQFHEMRKISTIILGVENVTFVDEALDQLHKVIDSDVSIILYDGHFRFAMLQFVFQGRVAGYFTLHNDFDDMFKLVTAVLEGNRAFSPLPGEVTIVTKPMGHQQAGLGSPHFFLLSERELELLRLLVAGNDLYYCGEVMGITVKSADNLKTRLMKKLNVHSVAQLIVLGVKYGLGPH